MVSAQAVAAAIIARLPAEPPIDISREEAQRRANEELSKAKYGGIPDPLQDILNWIQEMLRSLLQLVTGQVQPGAGVSWGFIIVIVVAILVLGIIIWRVGLPRWQQRRAKDADIEIDQSVSPAEYRDLAEAAAARGDYRTAVRERFRAIVRELEFRTIITPRPSRTALEAATAASRELPTTTGPMHAAATLFSAVMYGDRAATRDDWQQILAAETAVHAAADHPVEVDA